MTTVLNTLEKPSQADKYNAHMAKMKVKGSLLHAALKRLDGNAGTLEKMTWSETAKPGVLQLTGTVLLSTEAERAPIAFRLSAEFWGTRDGTVMAVLDLKEDR